MIRGRFGSEAAISTSRGARKANKGRHNENGIRGRGKDGDKESGLTNSPSSTALTRTGILSRIAGIDAPASYPFYVNLVCPF